MRPATGGAFSRTSRQSKNEKSSAGSVGCHFTCRKVCGARATRKCRGAMFAFTVPGWKRPRSRPSARKYGVCIRRVPPGNDGSPFDPDARRKPGTMRAGIVCQGAMSIKYVRWTLHPCRPDDDDKADSFKKSCHI